MIWVTFWEVEKIYFSSFLAHDGARKSNCWIIFLRLFSVIFSWQIYIFTKDLIVDILYKFVPISSCFSEYWKHLSSWLVFGIHFTEIYIVKPVSKSMDLYFERAFIGERMQAVHKYTDKHRQLTFCFFDSRCWFPWF